MPPRRGHKADGRTKELLPALVNLGAFLGRMRHSTVPSLIAPASEPSEPGEDLVFTGRKVLLLNHMPKTGGTTLRELLPMLVGKGRFDMRREFQSSTIADRKRAFVVVSYRDPCSYYSSLYSYGRGGEGALQKTMKLFASSTARAVFAQGVDPQLGFERFACVFGGLMSVRMALSLPDLQADCWVRTYRMMEDVERCMLAFEAQGGKLNPGWRQTLNQTLGKPRKSRHLSCSGLFKDRPQLAELVARREAPMCELMGGCHCCSKKPPLIDPEQASRFKWPSDLTNMHGAVGHIRHELWLKSRIQEVAPFAVNSSECVSNESGEVTPGRTPAV